MELGALIPLGDIGGDPAVVRDYATFASKYSAVGNAVTASRHLNFLERQIPADRAADYNAFVRAVHNDESQEFTLDRPDRQAPVSTAPPPPPNH